MAVIGIVYLALTTNFLATLLTALTVVIYILAYTPLKRVTTDQHVGRRDSRRASASDRVGRSSRLAQFRSLDFVRDRLRLANPALLRYRLALSSRLRAGRISHALERR